MMAQTPRARVRVTMLDGTVVEAEGAWMVAADRFALETTFGVSMFALFAGAAEVDESKWPEIAARLQERHLAFLVWCLLRREGKHFGTFEQFTQQVESYEIEVMPGNPGGQIQQPASSPS